MKKFKGKTKMPRKRKGLTEFDSRLKRALAAIDSKFSHRTKSLGVYAHSGLDKKTMDFIHRTEIVHSIPRSNIVAFALLIKNQLNNSGLSNTMLQYFDIENLPWDDISPGIYKYFPEMNMLHNIHIEHAYNKVKPETLDSWNKAIEQINIRFGIAAYIPRNFEPSHIMKEMFNPPEPVRIVKVKSSSPSEWRKKLRLKNGLYKGSETKETDS